MSIKLDSHIPIFASVTSSNSSSRRATGGALHCYQTHNSKPAIPRYANTILLENL